MTNEHLIRLIFFGGTLIGFSIWEHCRPKRPRKLLRRQRWLANFSLVVVNSLLARFLLPITAAATAVFAESHNFGLFNQGSAYLFLLTFVLSLVLLDFLIYLQHVIFHAVPIFWRFHKVHHIDQEIDVSTGLRFHPVEILLSALIKCLFVLLLGAPVSAVIAFEIILNASSMFNHGNISLSEALDAKLRRFIVTPDMHRVHHSIVVKEYNSNYGFNLAIWDKIFDTYREQPTHGHEAMEIGLRRYREAKDNSLKELIQTPFYKDQKKQY